MTTTTATPRHEPPAMEAKEPGALMLNAARAEMGSWSPWLKEFATDHLVITTTGGGRHAGRPERLVGDDRDGAGRRCRRRALARGPGMATL